MIYFGIPLKSKAASNNWDNVVILFNHTLRSVYSQTDPEFRIIVACHDMPTLFDQYDDRVEFLFSDQPVPIDKNEMIQDKAWKVQMIACRIRELGGGYVMMVDSDDLVSNRIAEYVNSHAKCYGYLSRTGYIYVEGTDYIKRVLAMHRICGSCSIVNYAIEDLPDSLPHSLADESPKEKYIVCMSHRIIPRYLKTIGRKLTVLPFPSTIYVRNTGDNHSMLDGVDLNWKRRAESAFRRKIPLHDSLRNEYKLI